MYVRPGVPLRLGVGARDEDAPVGDVRVRRPDLLAVDDEVAVARARRSSAPREVGAGARLGEALAPDLLAGEDVREVALLLLVRAVGDDRRPGHAEADHSEGPGASARAHSSRRIAWCEYEAPWPPYSLGHVSPA